MGQERKGQMKWGRIGRDRRSGGGEEGTDGVGRRGRGRLRGQWGRKGAVGVGEEGKG